MSVAIEDSNPRRLLLDLFLSRLIPYFAEVFRNIWSIFSLRSELLSCRLPILIRDMTALLDTRKPFLKHCALLCTSFIRSVGSLGPSCFRHVRYMPEVQVFILHGLPRGKRTHGKRVSAQIDTTQCYGQ